MTTWAILATGPSMSQAVADSVRGRCKVVAVSDAYRLAPWADVLVSTDGAWWRQHPQALEFAGEKYSMAPDWKPVPGVKRPESNFGTGVNSGLLACDVAVRHGAKRLLLLGFDMGGSHFFGVHPSPLKNTPPDRFERFKRQFEMYRPRGVQILNCTPGSALKAYKFADLHESLAEPAPSGI